MPKIVQVINPFRQEQSLDWDVNNLMEKVDNFSWEKFEENLYGGNQQYQLLYSDNSRIHRPLLEAGDEYTLKYKNVIIAKERDPGQI